MENVKYVGHARVAPAAPTPEAAVHFATAWQELQAARSARLVAEDRYRVARDIFTRATINLSGGVAVTLEPIPLD